MTPAETIQAAIAKLTRLRDEAEPGPWLVIDRSDPGNDFERYGYDIQSADGEPVTQGGMSSVRDGAIAAVEDAQLIVTLHATIDAQMAILSIGNAIFYGDFKTFTPKELRDVALILAKAILGEQVDA